MNTPPTRANKRRIWCGLLAAAVGVPAAWLAIEAARIEREVAPFVTADVAQVPQNDVGLVLGCSPTLADGRRNSFFEARIRAASELYRGGKVGALIVSGDNGTPGYDEPSAMADALVAEGVPRAAITRDFAGFRTLDSMIRAKEVFGLARLTVISQRFHVERAVFVGRAHGLDAVGFAAGDVGGRAGLKFRMREIVSRIVAVLDVRVLDTRPKFTGPPIAVSRLGLI